MKEQEYYQEIEHLIKKNEIGKRARRIEENYSLVETYWHIGKIIVEAQGGLNRAEYGNELIKKWSIQLTQAYGKGYNYTNLSRFRQFYLYFPILATLWQVSWSHYRRLLSIKDENKRNFYLNLCIKKHLSERELTKVNNEHDLELNILSNLDYFFKQLGEWFCLYCSSI